MSAVCGARSTLPRRCGLLPVGPHRTFTAGVSGHLEYGKDRRVF